MDREFLQTLLQLAGWSQVVLIMGSLGIPHVLGWREKLGSLSTLLRQMFWVYSAYIWLTNLCFGLLSALATTHLLDGSMLAACVTGFILSYWLLRMVVQWLYFDISEIPMTGFNVFARWSLEILFTSLTVVYGLCFAHNIGWL
ncbi:MAG: hypothetical protein AAGN82_17290 [Myxococcota bacterium]